MQTELATVTADRDELQRQLEEAQSANQRWREAFKELEGERDNLEWQVRVHIDEKQSLKQELEEVRSSASPEPEQQPAPAIDLSEKAWDVYSVVKPWLVPKAPKSLRSTIEEKLGGVEK